ncbi:MAG: hypothetical protein IJB20_06440, partial [Clostridia bacterium]|nr:hypothetical protein [Clostridia bacterium]
MLSIRQAQPRQNENQPRDSNLIQAENGTEAENLDPFHVGQIVTASWNEREDGLFDQEGMRRGVETVTLRPDDEWGNHAVYQKSAPGGSIQPAVISGPTAVRVLFEDETSLEYPFAVPIPGRSDVLKASPFGKNRILWHSEPEGSIEPCE